MCHLVQYKHINVIVWERVVKGEIHKKKNILKDGTKILKSIENTKGSEQSESAINHRHLEHISTIVC